MVRPRIGRLRIALVSLLLTVSACASGARDMADAKAAPASETAVAKAMQPVSDSARYAGFPLPRPVGFVNDFAGVVPAETQRMLADTLERIQKSTGGDIVLVTLPDLAGIPSEVIARRIGIEWRIGAQDGPARHAGVVVLIAPKESSSDGRGYCRIELGDGATPFISDSLAASLCRSATPAFVLRNYGEGMRLIALELARRYRARFGRS
ncbi:MAG: TPM domain-containing protein [Gemmatimonadota bacterium]